MCGIIAVFDYQGDEKKFRPKMLSLSKKIRHRGPDCSGIEIIGDKHALTHERLAIVDVKSGSQPLISRCGKCVLTANGEIYNHVELQKKKLLQQHTFGTKSDCEIILHLYEEMGEDCVKFLDGDFAFVLYDGEHYIAARDPIGINTLYQGWAADGSVWFASEMKCLVDDCVKICAFPPGHLYSSRSQSTVPYYSPSWFNISKIPSTPYSPEVLRVSLEKAVMKRLMSDVPYGVFLSGGLDSSLIASIAARHLGCYGESKKKRMTLTNGFAASVPTLRSFSIGLVDSPDLLAARRAAQFLGTEHHEFTFTVQEGIDALCDVIYHLETYDVTTIRASTPMYFLSRKAKSTGVKMVLSGEGADEVFAGYLYFHSAPSADELHRETVSRVRNLHLSDCLRANKSTMAWGLEVRVPFLDEAFLDVAMTMDPKEKLAVKGERIEKYVVRKAFDVQDDPYLPKEILWRQKEQFSDGVGYGWIDGLKAYAESQVTDEEMKKASIQFPYDTPVTKESYYYRTLFDALFPKEVCAQTVKRWIPRTDWGCSADPSGRAQKVHISAL